MNTERTFTTSYRRILIALLVAVTLLLTTLMGQIALHNQLGLDLTATAYACQHSGGGGC